MDFEYSCHVKTAGSHTTESLPNLDHNSTGIWNNHFLFHAQSKNSRGCNVVLGSSLLHSQVQVKISWHFLFKWSWKWEFLSGSCCCLHTHTLASSDSLVWLLGWVPYTGGLAGGVDLLCLFLWQVCMLLKGRGTLLFCFSNAGQCDLLCSRCSNVSQQTIEHFPEYPRRIFDTGNGPVVNVKF